MNRRSKQPNRNPRDRRHVSPGATTEWSESSESSWLVASTIAFLVARPFVPGSAIAQQGYGAIFVVLWLLLLATWLGRRLRRAGTNVEPLAFQGIDAVVLAFFAIYVVSGVVAAVRGSPRPAVNVTWHWFSVAIAYFLMRQLLSTARLRRAAISSLIGLGVGMAAIGLEQAMISLPDARAEYLRYKDDPQQLYARTGQWLPEGSSARMQFEARLESAEPTATFALSNSLAALLVPVIVLVVGIVAWGGANGEWANGRWANRKMGLLVILCAVFICLVWTHSRSGLLASVAAGGVAMAMRARRTCVWLACGGAAACLGGLGLYLFQRDTLIAAANSFAYRVEYWQATWSMIRDFPLFGCGPGQFQDVYTAYKLPAASEEVADPHNFLLEVWSTGGTLAAAALIASLVAIAWRLGRAAVPAAQNRDCDSIASKDATSRRTLPHARDTLKGSRDGRPTADAHQLRFVYLGSVAGVCSGAAAAWLDGVPLSGSHFALALAGVAASLALMHRWVLAGTISLLLPGIAAGGLLLHFCVSGGIGEPALATILWGLVVIQLHEVSQPRSSRRSDSPARGFFTVSTTVALALAMVLVVAAYLTYYRPMLSVAGQLASADMAALAGENEQRTRSLEAAAAADPWSIEATRRLAAIQFAAWRQRPIVQGRDAWQRSDEAARRVAPRRHSAWRESAERYAALYHETSERDDLIRAIALIERAIALYPTHADHHLFYAELLLEDDRTDAARQALAKAIQFDRAKEAAGHEDRTLPADRRQELGELSRELNVELPKE